MSTKEFIRELENQLELENPLKNEADGIWLLSINEDTTMTILDLSPGYSFQCTVGVCPEKKAEDFLTKAMFGNLFGQGTFGGVLGLNGEGKLVMLAFENGKKVEYKKFYEDLEDFMNAVDYWRDETKK